MTWEALGFSLVSFGVVLLDKLANFVNKFINFVCGFRDKGSHTQLSNIYLLLHYIFQPLLCCNRGYNLHSFCTPNQLCFDYKNLIIKY